MKGLDSLKFFFSLVVVWIHTGVGNLGGLTYAAVPFFFVVSGFFLFGKLFDEKDFSDKEVRIDRWWRKTLRLYLIWSLIFMPYSILGLVHDQLGPVKAISLYFRNLILVGENYLSWPLWYLLGMLWAGAIIWFANKLRLPFWSLCLIALLLALTPKILSLEESALYLKLFKTTRNGFFIGFPFMVLGGLIRRFVPSMKNWDHGSWQEKTALNFRFLSIHIYLSHMIWAGLLILIWGFERGLTFWAITCAISIVTGLLIRPCDKMVKFLYGRTFRA